MLAELKIPNIAPYNMHIHADGDLYISEQIKKNGIWEPCETQLFCHLVNLNDTVLDIGANIGYYTLLASLLTGSNGMVYAFEPEIRNYKILVKNVLSSAFKNTVCVNKAVTNYTGEGSLYLHPNNLGHHSIHDSIESNNIQKVSVISIDDYFKDNPVKIDFLKIDAEGAEHEIIDGLKTVLNHSRDNIKVVFEFWPRGLDAAPGGLGQALEIIRNSFDKFMIIREAQMRVDEIMFDDLVKIGEISLSSDVNFNTNILCFGSVNSYEAVKRSFQNEF